MCSKFEVNIFNRLKNIRVYGGSIKLTIFRIKLGLRLDTFRIFSNKRRSAYKIFVFLGSVEK